MADTIAAVSTPSGRGAISIVRMCGERALDYALCFFNCKKLPITDIRNNITPNLLYLGNFCYGEIKEKCFFVFFRAPYSYTGEDMVEFQIHGGQKLTAIILNALFEKGARPATPGEFTRRAYLNGKLSLTDAEGIIDVIDADSESALKAGYRILNGKLGKITKEIEDSIMSVLANIEAGFDYPEEMADEIKEGREELIRLTLRVENLVAAAKKGRMIKEGIKVAILGRPNVGKSSLLNAFLGEDRAIVTSIAGTTRDTIRESMEYDGKKITFLDTAGIRESEDVVESIGVERAKKVAKEADVTLYVIDDEVGENAEDNKTVTELGDKVVIKVYNKTDITGRQEGISAKNGKGIDKLLDKISATINSEKIESEDIFTEERHITALRNCLTHLKNSAESDAPEDCVALELRLAYDEIASIEGKDAKEEVVDNVFSRFCVGK